MAKTPTPQPQPSHKKKAWLAIVAGLIVVLLSWWAWNEFMPRPLGDRLEYLGKEDYGNVLGFDYFPSSVYYYGTDVAPEELADYFPKATYAPQDNFAFEHARFITPDDKTFIFTYKHDSHFTTEKKYIISLPGSQYQHAKSSL